MNVGDKVSFPDRIDRQDGGPSEEIVLTGEIIEIVDAAKLYRPPVYSAIAKKFIKTPLKTRFPEGSVVYRVKCDGATRLAHGESPPPIIRNVHESQVCPTP